MTWFLLSLVGHGQAENEFANYGVHHPRLLNISGRWSAAGSRAVPLLGWLDERIANQAAARASGARSRAVEVVQAPSGAEGVIHGVSGPDHAALLGYLPYSAAAAHGMTADVGKTMAFAGAVLSVFGADVSGRPEDAALEVHRSMKAKFGGGSVVSAAQFLCGRKAHDVLCRVLEGEIECSGGLTRAGLIEAFILARLVVGKLSSGVPVRGPGG